MRTSDYTERFQLVERSYSKDSNGDQRRSEEVVFEGYARVLNLSGREYWEAFAVSQESTVKVHARWNPVLGDIDPRKVLLRMRGRDFEVSAIDNVAWRNELCTIKAKEVVRGSGKHR